MTEFRTETTTVVEDTVLGRAHEAEGKGTERTENRRGTISDSLSKRREEGPRDVTETAEEDKRDGKGGKRRKKAERCAGNVEERERGE